MDDTISVLERPDPESPEARKALTPEAAFTESAAMYFRGQLLKPSRKRVEYAAQALGNRVLCGTANLSDGALYEGFLVDVVVMMYLCTCPASEVMKAVRMPDKVLEQALEWGDLNEISLGSEAWDEAVGNYWSIFEQINKSRFKVEPPERKPGDPAPPEGNA
jgi:hypothetical protein